MQSEAQITRKSLDALKKRGGFWFKAHGGPHQPAGLADINGCYRSIYVAIEMKRPDKRDNLTPRQEKKLRDVNRAGGIARVCTSPAECLAVLDEIDQRLERKKRGHRS